MCVCVCVCVCVCLHGGGLPSEAEGLHSFTGTGICVEGRLERRASKSVEEQQEMRLEK